MRIGKDKDPAKAAEREAAKATKAAAMEAERQKTRRQEDYWRTRQYEEEARRGKDRSYDLKPKPGTFVYLNCRVAEGGVFAGSLDPAAFGRTGTVNKLGALRGARAEIGDSVSRHGTGTAVAATLALGPIGLLAAAGKRTQAFVVLADGTVHTSQLEGRLAIMGGQRDVVAFNALVAATSATQADVGD